MAKRKKAGTKAKVTKAQMKATLDNAVTMIQAVAAAVGGTQTARQDKTVRAGGLAVSGTANGCACGKA